MPSQPTAAHRLSRPRTRLRILSVAAIITGGLLIASPAHATDGTLDTTFGVGVDGKVTTSISNNGRDGDAASIAVQADGKILVAGNAEMTGDYSNYDFALVRYNDDGTLDEDFHDDGIVTTDLGGYDYGRSVAIQPEDGKILVAGYTSIDGWSDGDFALVRYNTNGTLDTNFGTAGIVTTSAGVADFGYSVAIQTDGKILVAGSTDGDFALVRYNDDGTLDEDFHDDGIVITSVGGTDSGYSVTIQTDGKILVAGQAQIAGNYDFALVRYNDDGTLDEDFHDDGIVITSVGGTDSGDSVAIQPEDGKILVAGKAQISSNYDFALIRYNLDGTLDTSFDGDGIVTADLGEYDYGSSVAIQQDGRILVAGGTGNQFGLLRVNSDGTRDTSFGSAGILSMAKLMSSLVASVSPRWWPTKVFGVMAPFGWFGG